MLRACTFWIVLWPLALFSSCRCSGDSGQPRVRIGEHVWRVELAADEQTRRRGLAGRDEIPEGTGMLFIFDREEVLTFHMLDCRAGLDVAFISAEGRILHIRTMPVEQDPRDPKCDYSSKYPARFALEVAAGAFERAGVKVGDKVELLGRARDAATRVLE